MGGVCPEDDKWAVRHAGVVQGEKESWTINGDQHSTKRVSGCGWTETLRGSRTGAGGKFFGSASGAARFLPFLLQVGSLMVREEEVIGYVCRPVASLPMSQEKGQGREAGTRRDTKNELMSQCHGQLQADALEPCAH